MKKFWVRETLYLMLPVLFIGGGILLKNIWTSPADTGPRRIEVVGFKPIELNPIDVARGMSWGTEIETRTRGDARLPKKWQMKSRGTESKLSFVYRRGKVWKRVPFSKDSVGVIFTFGGRNEHSIRVDLNNVPKDAEEVRMRGTLVSTEYCRGQLPTGWTPPKNLISAGTLQELKYETKPVDVVIKAVGKPIVVPQVSRIPKVSLVEARWYSEHYGYGAEEEFFLHLRHSENKDWSSENKVIVDNLKFSDANGKEIPIYNNLGQGNRSYGRFTYFNVNSLLYHDRPGNQERFSPNKPGSDLIVPLLNNDEVPRKPWNSYKQPIQVEAEVSDGICWPTKIKATFRHKNLHYNANAYDDLKKFGKPRP